MYRRLAFQSLDERRLLAVDSLVVEPFETGLESPVVATHAGDGSGRLFVAEQDGLIRIINQNGLLADPFLNLSDQLVTGGASGERGLLGLAFHPDYAVIGSEGEGRFFVYHSAPSASGDHDSVIVEYNVLEDRPNVADPLSRREILRFNQPFANHNGGDLAFGPDDGLLYISSGDGGGSGDPLGHGQDTSTLLGAILRIDIDGDDFQDRLRNYAIPPENPFVDDVNARDEIFAYGLRNPFRIAFDDGEFGEQSEDRLFVGDVGQEQFEEINLVEAGGNYGWNLCEGSHVFGQPTADCPGQFEAPIAEYGRDEGFSVIGGRVYRGSLNPALEGVYVFGDLNGTLMTLERQPDGGFERNVPTIVGVDPDSIIGFGEDEAGELYVLTFDSILTVGAPPLSSLEVQGAGEVNVSFAGDELVIRDATAEVFRGPTTSFAGLTLVLSSGDDQVSVADWNRLAEARGEIQAGAGVDAIRLLDEGQTLDLTALSQGQFAQFEQIDVTGSGSNQLILDQDSVLTLLDGSDRLRVIHDQDDLVDYGQGWEVELPTIEGGAVLHRIAQDAAIVEIANSLAFQNPLNRNDANRDGQVTSLDALQIINALALQNGELGLPTTIDDSFLYGDVSGDNAYSALDVLRVINQLDRESVEAEFIVGFPTQAASDDDDRFSQRVVDDSPSLF